MGSIGDRLAVGRVGSLRAGGQRQRLRHAGAVGVNEEELEEVTIAERAAGDEDVFAVGRPANDLASGRMPGDATGHAALRRSDVDVGVAVEVGGVGDLGAVRRKERTGLHLPIRGEPLGIAALPAHRPDIVGVEKGDLVLRERGVAQQQRMIGWGLGGDEAGARKRQRKAQKAQTGSGRGSSGLQRRWVELSEPAIRLPACCATEAANVWYAGCARRFSKNTTAAESPIRDWT